MIYRFLFLYPFLLSVSAIAQDRILSVPSINQGECLETFRDSGQNHFKAKKALIVGGGSYGTAFAQVLSKNFKELVIITRNEHIVDQINNLNKSDKLPDIKLSPNIKGTTQWEELSSNNFDLIALALPIQELRMFLNTNHDLLLPFLKDTPIVSLSKGIDIETSFFPKEIILEEFPFLEKDQLYFISGPSFADEMAKGRKTFVSLSGYESEGLEKIQNLISTEHFQISLTNDVTGVSFAGAAKNILAIASGIAKGLDTGHNTRAALIVKINEELMSMGNVLGIYNDSYWSPAYFGDIVLSLEEESRNTRFGIALGRGVSPSEFFEQHPGINVEGFGTVKALYFRMKDNFSVLKDSYFPFPLIQSLYQILYENKDPEELLALL